MTPANRHLLALACWGIAQCALLAIGASGYPLWLNHPVPHDSLTLSILLCGQMMVVSLWVPGLGLDARALWRCVLLMVPLDELAGLLGHASQLSTLFGFASIALWMLGLGIWGTVLKESEVSRQIVALIAALWMAGGALLDYLRWEANLAAGSINFEAFSPFAQIVRTNWAKSRFFWFTMGFPLITAILYSTWNRQRENGK